MSNYANKHVLFSLPIEELQELVAQTIRHELSIYNGTNPKVSTEGNYVSRKEVAKTLGISLPTLSKYVKQGFIKAHRIGSKVLFAKTDVEASLKEIETFKHSRRNPIL